MYFYQHFNIPPSMETLRMNYCEKNFVDRIGKVLSSRKRRVIEHPPFSHAAVLVPLFKKGEDCHLLFTKRSDQVKYHKGEISFPGGSWTKRIWNW